MTRLRELTLLCKEATILCERMEAETSADRLPDSDDVEEVINKLAEADELAQHLRFR